MAHHHHHRDNIGTWRRSNGKWYTREDVRGSHPIVEIQAGLDGDIAVPADYFGEGKSRLAVFRPSNGTWYIKGRGHHHWSESHENHTIQCGLAGDIPVPGDYFGEGRARIAVFRPSNGTWYIKGADHHNWDQSHGNLTVQLGLSGDIPVPADYHGEGRLRLAVWRPSNGTWYIKQHANNSGESSFVAVQCGQHGDIPVPADYFGEGRARIAVWRPSNANWYVKGHGFHNWAETHDNHTIQCGLSGDIPVPGRYTDSHRVNIAVYRPSNGTWYIKGHGHHNWDQTHDNVSIQHGLAEDVPLPRAYNHH